MNEENPVRESFAIIAVKKALKAFKRHGENSYQFRKAMRSRWMKGQNVG